MLATSAQWLSAYRDPVMLSSCLHHDRLGGKQRGIETFGSLFYLRSDVDCVAKHRELKAMFVTDKSVIHLAAVDADPDADRRIESALGIPLVDQRKNALSAGYSASAIIFPWFWDAEDYKSAVTYKFVDHTS